MPAFAGPQSCTLGQGDTVATCSGNQSNGVSFDGSADSVTTVNLKALTKAVAPAAPNAGIVLKKTGINGTSAGAAGGNAPALSVSVDKMAVIKTQGTANVPAPAITVTGIGGNGRAGANAVDANHDGKRGGNGGNGSGITIVNDGALSSSNVRSANSRAREFGLQSELNDASQNLADSTRERSIRSFLLTTTDSTIETICGAFLGKGPQPCSSAEAVNPTVRGLIITAQPNAYTSEFGTSTSFPFISDSNADLDVEIRTDSVTKTYLSHAPLPEEMRGRAGVTGVLSAISTGGNGANGGEGGTNTGARGGTGGDGGSGGAISVFNHGAISSTGNFNSGILAISQGGNAGDGGSNSVGLLTHGTGGIGGIGGAGGAVNVLNTGTITTTGTDSTGIYAQSVGGTGATGRGTGNNDGSAGGTGGSVSVNDTGTINTRGYGAYGVFAQSLGGTGGASDNNDGGTGGAAGRATVSISGDITTAGKFAYGVFASSQGGTGGAGGDGNGDGGNGGAAAKAAVTIASGSAIKTAGDGATAVYAQSKGGFGGVGASSTSLFWASAGGGGNGGLGGDASITSRGSVRTGGQYAFGLFAQSLGGGGGYGGHAAALVAQSGAGGSGARSGKATVKNFGTVATAGVGSYAIFAQSVAGGGGDAGSSGGLVALGGNGGSEAEDKCKNDPKFCNNGGTVTVANDGSLKTSGNAAAGIFAESIGGGGGNGGSSTGLITIGGDGGAGGNGGAVSVTNNGAVSTGGSAAQAIFAQSVGGGGGNGGDATSLGVSTTVSLGGSGGSGGDGGKVTIANHGKLAASGDRSAGIYAQSVGGGGGNGGNASAKGLSALTVAVGGSGGDGGDAGAVAVNNTGTVAVGGDRSTGILAQSVGGGGGNGGSASTFGVAPVAQISVAVGGQGGGGGEGSTVNVDNSGAIITTGVGSRGIFAQSVGGGGGTGGDASATSLSAGAPGAPVSVSIGVAVGGQGGDGGNGGKVTVANRNGGSITTFGDYAHAIQAQSVGGGGGSGGSASASAKIIKAQKNGVAVSVAVGGSGGDGGNGNAVKASNNGVIVTDGANAYGVFAQSVGGGGGNGGDATSNSSVDAEKLEAGVAVSVGGSGGGGGNGGNVTVTNAGSIMTGGASAFGVFAQSVGGGGGTGGTASSSMEGKISPSVSVGGSGGDGGAGHEVSITSSGTIATAGDRAIAVFSQSVGGGGGVGGDATGTAKASDNPDKKTYDVSVSVGGSGGDGGNGGTVQVRNTGTLETIGANAYGVLAQSVGGGGGIGGGAKANGNDGSYSLAVSVGGHGGVSGNGGKVKLSNAGSIATAGNLSYGIFAESVGGGGGGGGTASSESSSRSRTTNTEKGALSVSVGGYGGAAGNGGMVTVANSGSIETFGYGAHGIFAQSIGGGGGVGASGDAEGKGKVNVGGGLGGNGGTSGKGGTVAVTNTGGVSTYGDDAYGVLAQSVGGGGGVGVGNGGSGNGNGSGLKSIGVSVGGNAGASGNGGSVKVTQAGDIWTTGVQSFGILAQSIGGGGGVGGAGESNTGGQISVGGAGGTAGNGGAVAVKLKGNITTTGDGAHGIFAQSIGGGGGIGGEVNTQTEDTDLKVTTIKHQAIAVGAGVTGAGGGAGNGGAISINSAGTITTTGENAYGILAQSVGGGGGVAGSNDGGTLTMKIGSSSGGSGHGGAIAIKHTGNIYALGAGSHGIFAQSTGPGGAGGNINITVAGGDIVGGGWKRATGGARGAGIYVDQGADNTIAITRKSSVSALSGLAIKATSGDDTVNNAGVVDGDVLLGAGNNAFNNGVGGSLITGSKIDLGAGNMLTNNGTLDIGGVGTVRTTTLSGNLDQTATGVLMTDVRFNHSKTSDLLKVTGSTKLAGTIKPYNLYLMPGVTIGILKSSGALTNKGVHVKNTATVTYGLTLDHKGGATVVDLTVKKVNFGAPPGLSGDQRSLAQVFQTVWNTGGAPSLAPTMGYLVNLAPTAYSNALDHLTPAPYLSQVTGATNTGFNFVNNMMSCHGFDGSYAAIREHECNWAKVVGGVANQSGTTSTVGYRDTYKSLQFGRQMQLAPDWFLGLAGAYERSNTSTDTNASSAADRFGFGAVIKHEMGPWLVAGAIDGGYAALHNSRFIGFPTPGLTATSESSIWNIDARARFAYLIEQNAWCVKPMADFDLLYVNMPSVTESGAGALNLHTASLSDNLFAVTPGVEIGATLPWDDANVIRPFASVGATWYSKNSWTVTSSLQGAPSSTFTTASTFPQTLANISAGIDIFSAKKTGGLDVRLEYDAHLAQHYTDQKGALKFAIRF